VPIKDEDSDIDFLRKVEAAQKQLEQRQSKTVMDWVDEYITVRQLRPTTARNYRTYMTGYSFDDDLNRQKIQKLLTSQIKQSTKLVQINTSRCIFSWMIEHGVQVKNPAIDVHIKAISVRSRTITDEEMSVINEYIDEWIRIEPLYALYILVMQTTGTRVSSVFHLKWQDLDAQNRIHLLNVKANKPYSYPIPIVDERLIRLWRFMECKRPMWKSPVETMHRYQARLTLWMHERFGLDSKGERLSPHSFRHTFASRALQSGVPLEVVSKLLDHASPATTIKVYARFSEDQILDAIKKTFG
jgi:integrase/recombinase XerD